jgi:hypothetical protein
MTLEGGVVRYFKNGGIFYTSATPVTSTLRLHAVLFNMNATITGIGLGGSTSTTSTTTTSPTSTTTTEPAPTKKPSPWWRRR